MYMDVRFETLQQTKIQAYLRQTNSGGHNICMYRIYCFERGCLHTPLDKNLDKHKKNSADKKKYMDIFSVFLVVYQ